jgi:surface protein
MDTASKLNKLLETKEQIRHSIEKKGVEIGKDVPFADYPNKIAEITGSEGGGKEPEEKLTGSYALFKFREDEEDLDYNEYYKKAQEVEISNLKVNTSNMSDMFLFRDYDHDRLEKITFSNLDTSNVEEMHDMFKECYNLKTINGTGDWDTSNVRRMSWMFQGCNSLEELDLSNWDTSNVGEIQGMFQDCRRLHTLRLDNCNEDTIRKIIESESFPTGQAEDWGETRKIYCLEKNVGKLTAPNGWEFVDCETGEIIGEKLVNYEKGMFSEEKDIEEVSVMVTYEHTDLSDMFQECEKLKTINGIKNWDTSRVETMAGMFAGCKSLESLDLSSFNTIQVTNMTFMFLNCENLRELNLSNFEIRQDCYTGWMFQECRKLHTLRLDNCSRETVERIINSSWFPTGKAEDYEGTRKIYCKYFEVYDLTSPDGWVFEYID